MGKIEESIDEIEREIKNDYETKGIVENLKNIIQDVNS